MPRDIGRNDPGSDMSGSNIPHRSLLSHREYAKFGNPA